MAFQNHFSHEKVLIYGENGFFHSLLYFIKKPYKKRPLYLLERIKVYIKSMNVQNAEIFGFRIYGDNIDECLKFARLIEKAAPTLG